MALVKGSDRIVCSQTSDPTAGAVRWRPGKSLWISAMTIAGLVGGLLTFSWDAFAVFLALTAITLCAGHSVGMHRRLIHESFQCPLWLEYALVYLGTLVGMAGPFGMMKQHDLRDWAQRQSACHDYLCHRRGFWRDYFWQCHCDIELDHAPQFIPEQRLRHDRIYHWMERYWMLQQAPLGLVLFLLGGWSYLIWGIPVRVAVSVTGHWLVGHYAHHDYGNEGATMTWRVNGAAVQGLDVPIAGLISMGESWHNNHHAYPGSAKIGLLPGQPDLGWQFIRLLKWLGLAWNIRTPDNLEARKELVRLSERGAGCSICLLWRRLWGAWFGG